MNRPDASPKNSILIYTAEDGLTKIDTTFDGDTVWLSIDQMAELFQRDKSTISRHIKNIFAEGELERDSVVVKFATTAADEENQVSKTPPAYRMFITRYTGGVYFGVLYSFSGFTQLLNEVRK